MSAALALQSAAELQRVTFYTFGGDAARGEKGVWISAQQRGASRVSQPNSSLTISLFFYHSAAAH